MPAHVEPFNELHEPVKGAPAWDVAHLLPAQGDWSQEAYLDLPGRRLVEFDNGVLEVLSMPTTHHQDIVIFLLRALAAFVEPAALGKVSIAPLPVLVAPHRFREPDVLFCSAHRSDRIHEKHWDGADLVIEVVSASEKDRQRDLVEKRRDYARAGIAEYWIVDPREHVITVLSLGKGRYRVHGVFGAGARAESVLLAGFEVSVDDALRRR